MRKYWMMALAVALSALFGGALFAMPASAQVDPAFEHGYPDVTASPTDTCGEIELTFINPTPWLFVFDVRVDGEEAINPSVAPGVEIEEGPLAGQEFGPRWRLITVDGRDDEHEVTETFEFTSSVEVRLAEGGEQKLFFDWKTVDVSKVQPCPTDEDGEDGRDSEENEPPDGDSTCELVDQLEVADEHGRDGYDRDLFGEYDRDALLAESLAEYGDYYSFWDNQHYDDPSEVDVDHTVALAEAWDSGAHAWSEEQRDKFTADPANLTLLTDNLNASKGDRDIAEWLPPYEPHVDEYVLAYVGVKAAYGLTVDPAEQVVLLQLAEELGLCQAAGNEPSTDPSTEAGPTLPTTGSSLPVVLGGAAVLLGLTGGGLMALARRWRTTFRAE